MYTVEVQTGIFIVDFIQSQPLEALFFVISIVLAVTVHEFAHAYVASRQGDQTARMMGRVSLNPAAHLDPAGSFLFLLAGIGWGRPVMVNPYNLKSGRRGDFYVSIAGIVTNLAVAAIFAIPFRIIQMTGGDIAGAGSVWLDFARMVIYVNVLLAAFNVIPIPPLDGSKAIGILVPRSLWPVYQRYLQVGPALLIGIFLIAVVLKVNLIGPVLDPLIAFFQYVVAGFPTGIL